MTGQHTADDDTTCEDAEIAELRQQAIAALYRCISYAAAGLARDHETCVRQACRRARHCRRSVCLADGQA